MSKKNDLSEYMTKADCKVEMRALQVSLVGEDMRGGLVKDVQEIKSQTSIFKTILLPIITSVITALIVAALLGAH